MKKQTKVPQAKAIPAIRLAPSSVVISPETVEHMKQCEAREWMKRRKDKAMCYGTEAMQLWWEETKNDIKKRRGDQGLADLIRRMEAERNADKAPIPAKRVDAQQQKRQALGGNALGQEEVQRGLFLPD